MLIQIICQVSKLTMEYVVFSCTQVNCHITSTSRLLNHRYSFQISHAYYITAGKREFLDVAAKENEHRFKGLFKWESVKTWNHSLRKKYWLFDSRFLNTKTPFCQIYIITPIKLFSERWELQYLLQIWRIGQ